ncbi:VanZ family protein [Alkalihalobacillus trypoxylicola]|uniref:VanZ-like domain-containing protein n=1 Tax=Alkalihalobacillus trypoxylicola TaxID=519424 RepID=A0A162DQQ3_9BACI|nr:VanZ family protein [Alkalihalobacillus trypoxylicola]KYG30585.1 hypothetical protein AZF04_19250 [Alkalihalobacillus trypoxylicola]
MKKWFVWIPALLWMGLIFFLSHQPGNDSGALSGGITKTIIDAIQYIVPKVEVPLETLHFIIRKGAHFFSYFVLAILYFFALNKMKKLSYNGLVAFLMATIYAITDEFHQYFIPGRVAAVTDVMIDSLGALCGIISYMLALKVVKYFIKR